MFMLLEHSLHLSAPLAIALSVAMIAVRLFLRRARGGQRSRN
ncbi:MAG: hypothetical protein ACRDP7_42845 [Trebonia sp.]